MSGSMLDTPSSQKTEYSVFSFRLRRDKGANLVMDFNIKFASIVVRFFVVS
jgi:hypothetical protein